jgi:hypothetical protein
MEFPSLSSESEHEVSILNQALPQGPKLALVEGIESHHQISLMEHRNELIKEYECVTPSDFMLCELAAGAMARHLSASQKLKYFRDEYWSTTNRRTRSGSTHYQKQEDEWTTVRDHLHRIEIESKEVDRSLRQYQSIIAQLSQRKTPMTEVHIKTAFMAQNQQINVPKTV